MKLTYAVMAAAVCAAPVANPAAYAQNTSDVDHSNHAHHAGHDGHAGHGDIPVGVMGGHLHKKGEFMLSYRYMHMDMSGSRIGTNSASTDQIATTVPNQFFGTPGQPPTLRVVPTNMKMNMHMIGGMYAPSDTVTLMVMGMYTEADMDHITYMGGMGTTQLGEFTTRSSDIGDTKVAALVSLFDNGSSRAHLNLGISIPTGTISETDEILTPMGMQPTVTLPYPMQIGSGTWDLEPGITYTAGTGAVSWGVQAKATIRLGSNSADYSLGDRLEATSWVTYLLSDAVSASFRVKAATQGSIDGQNPAVVAPVQTAQTSFHGGERVDALGGLSYTFQSGGLKGHRLALEAGLPVYQDLNGPQLETDFTLTLGWSTSF